MGRLILLLLLIHVALAFAAVVDCLGGEQKPQRFSRFVWSLLIVFGLFAGPVTWFTYGRPGRKITALWSPDTAGTPPVAPDDDPDFLASLRDPSTPEPPAPPRRPPPRARPPDRQSDDNPARDAGQANDTTPPGDAGQANDTTPDDRNNPPG